MTFEEEFPSLAFFTQGRGDESGYFTAKALQQFCLDKQRVRDALLKLGKDVWKMEKEGIIDQISIIEKELGL